MKIKQGSDTESTRDEFYERLDKLSELNKLGGRGHGDLEDTCYICGISPSKLKAYLEQQIAVARIEELKKVGENDGEQMICYYEEDGNCNRDTTVADRITELERQLRTEDE